MLLTASLQFPTVVFTIALGIALVYWLFVLLGALDIDLFGGPEADLSGAAKGIGEVITGGAKGSAEVVRLEFDGDADGGGVWSGLGLGDVPMTITVSILVLSAWCGSLLLMHYVVPTLGLGTWFPPLLVPGMLLVSLPITAVLIRPLVPIFRITEGKSNHDYVGHTCTISTGSVDENFGQATVEDGGTVLVIPVRCDEPGKLARTDKALIIEFDPERQAYVVAPSIDMLAGDVAK
ncbi:MAG: hypothetical protein WKG01_10595 [Kofleriaceae bacterium]